MVGTIEQQVAEAQAKLARLKTRAKAQDTRRKIIVGAIVTTEALKDPKIAKWLASTLRKNATREVDQKELAGLLGVCCRTVLNPTLSSFRPPVLPCE
jgi:hypothetical protein